MTTNGKQTMLKLDLPPEPTHDDRIKAIMDLVVDRFGGDLSAYFEFIRPKEQSADQETANLTIIAERVAKCM